MLLGSYRRFVKARDGRSTAGIKISFLLDQFQPWGRTSEASNPRSRLSGRTRIGRLCRVIFNVQFRHDSLADRSSINHLRTLLYLHTMENDGTTRWPLIRMSRR